MTRPLHGFRTLPDGWGAVAGERPAQPTSAVAAPPYAGPVGSAAVGEGQIRVLGSLHLHSGGGRVSVGSEASLRLLASLVAAEGGFVGAAELSERLWGEDAPGSRLRMAVSRLRGRLAEVGLDDLLVTMPGGYRLEPRPGTVDAAVFQQLVEDARAVAVTSPERAMGMLLEALSLWTGPPYGGLGSELWLAGTVERLREQRLAAEDLLAGLQLRAGRAPAILDRLQRAVEDEPLREERWVHLVTALGATTRRSEALRALDRARRVLGRTVGLGLGPELRELEQDLLSGAGAGPAPAPWRAALDLVGRDAELLHLRRLLRSARVAVVIGLGGVGKSALATAFVAEVEATGLTVLRTAVDGVASPDELRAQLAATVGLQGTDDPEGLFDAIARRAPRDGLWVVDGAEADPEAVAAVVGALVPRRPPPCGSCVSRRGPWCPSPAPCPCRSSRWRSAPWMPRDPPCGCSPTMPGSCSTSRPPPTSRPWPASPGGAGACRWPSSCWPRASIRTGLHALAARDESASSPGDRGPAVGPRLDAGPVPDPRAPAWPSSPPGAARSSPAGCRSTARSSPSPSDRPCRPGSSNPRPAADGDRYCYQLAEPLRAGVARPRRPGRGWRRSTTSSVALAGDVGRLHGPADAGTRWPLVEVGARQPAALALAVRGLGRGHRPRHRDGPCLAGARTRRRRRRLAPAPGRAGRPTTIPPAAAARIAAAAIRGWLDIAAGGRRAWLRPAHRRRRHARSDWESWLHGSDTGRPGHRDGAGVDLAGRARAASSARPPRTRCAKVGDPWFGIQRQAVLALGPLGAGNFAQARAYLARHRRPVPRARRHRRRRWCTSPTA